MGLVLATCIWKDGVQREKQAAVSVLGCPLGLHHQSQSQAAREAGKEDIRGDSRKYFLTRLWGRMSCEPEPPLSCRSHVKGCRVKEAGLVEAVLGATLGF